MQGFEIRTHGSRTSQPPMFTPRIVSLPQLKPELLARFSSLLLELSMNCLNLEIRAMAYLGAAKAAEAAHSADRATLTSILNVRRRCRIFLPRRFRQMSRGERKDDQRQSPILTSSLVAIVKCEECGRKFIARGFQYGMEWSRD